MLLLFSVSASCAAQAPRVVLAGGDFDYAPYEYIDKAGQPAGFNVELLQAIGREMGFELRFDLGTWNTRRSAIARGELDVMAMFLSEARAGQLRFASPHVIIYHEMFVPVGKSIQPATLDDLEGLRVVVQQGAFAWEHLAGSGLSLNLSGVDTERAALLRVAAGEQDVALVSEALGRRMLHELGLSGLTTSGPPLLPVEYALAVRNDDPELHALIEQGLIRLRASGEFARLHQRWLGPSRAPADEVFGPLVWALLGVLLLSALAAGWRIRYLSRQVEQRAVQDAGDIARAGAAADVRASEREFQAIFAQAGVGLARLSLDGRWLAVNAHLAALLERPVAQLLELDFAAVFEGNEWPRLMRELQLGGEPQIDCELRVRDLSGAAVRDTRLGLRVCLFRDQGGKPAHALLVAHESRTEQRLLEQLDHYSRRDALTGLENRVELERRLAELLFNMGNSREQHTMLLIDLDQFKLINESFDHTAGDRLLRVVAATLREHAPKGAVLARRGGDEFAVLLPGHSLESAMQVAEGMRLAIQTSSVEVSGESLRTTASIGVVVVNAESTSPWRVMRDADAACYAAKEAGRNRLHVYREDDLRLNERQGSMQWARQVRLALDEDRFTLLAQRIHPLDEDNKQFMAEVLLRMKTLAGELISPSLFMAAAERYSLAQELDRWVFTRALAWLGDNAQRLDAISVVNINVSGVSLGDPGFQEFVCDALAASAFPARRLCLEITETAIIENFASALKVIQRLRQLGVRFAIDDFGVGLSSMAYLRELPVDFLKIDGSFCLNVHRSSRDRMLLAEINQLGHLMGKSTIAEHVETAAILAEVRDIGVDWVQGYHLHRPGPLDELLVQSSTSVS